MIKIYGDIASGNCLKVKWTADALRIPYQWIAIDVLAGDTHTPDYVSRFPFAQVPGLELADGRCLAQSNALIRYLARDTPWLPADPFQQAQIDQWLFWEQYSHEPYIAVCRFVMRYLGKHANERDPQKVERGERALQTMERHLSQRAYFAADTFTIADIALLAYTRVAHEGGFDLSPHAALRAWITRCETHLHNQGVTL
jgi:glutathione S-transferase